MRRQRVLMIGVALFFLLSGVSSHAATTKIPRLNCHKPVVPTKSNPTAAQVEAYNKALPKYRKCIERYVSDRSTAAKQYSELAQENARAADMAIRQFNALVKQAEANAKK